MSDIPTIPQRPGRSTNDASSSGSESSTPTSGSLLPSFPVVPRRPASRASPSLNSGEDSAISLQDNVSLAVGEADSVNTASLLASLPSVPPRPAPVKKQEEAPFDFEVSARSSNSNGFAFSATGDREKYEVGKTTEPDTAPAVTTSSVDEKEDKIASPEVTQDNTLSRLVKNIEEPIDEEKGHPDTEPIQSVEDSIVEPEPVTKNTPLPTTLEESQAQAIGNIKSKLPSIPVRPFSRSVKRGTSEKGQSNESSTDVSLSSSIEIPSVSATESQIDAVLTESDPSLQAVEPVLTENVEDNLDKSAKQVATNTPDKNDFTVPTKDAVETTEDDGEQADKTRLETSEKAESVVEHDEETNKEEKEESEKQKSIDDTSNARQEEAESSVESARVLFPSVPSSLNKQDGASKIEDGLALPKVPSHRPSETPSDVARLPSVPSRPLTRPVKKETSPAFDPSVSAANSAGTVKEIKTPPVVPVRPKRVQSFEPTNDAPSPKPKNKPAVNSKIGALRASLFSDLNSALARGPPPARGVPMAGLGNTVASATATTELSQDDSNAKSASIAETSRPDEGVVTSSDSRRRRARGPRDRRLPTEVKSEWSVVFTSVWELETVETFKHEDPHTNVTGSASVVNTDNLTEAEIVDQEKSKVVDQVRDSEGGSAPEIAAKNQDQDRKEYEVLAHDEESTTSSSIIEQPDPTVPSTVQGDVTTVGISGEPRTNRNALPPLKTDLTSMTSQHSRSPFEMLSDISMATPVGARSAHSLGGAEVPELNTGNNTPVLAPSSDRYTILDDTSAAPTPILDSKGWDDHTDQH